MIQLLHESYTVKCIGHNYVGLPTVPEVTRTYRVTSKAADDERKSPILHQIDSAAPRACEG
jgi:hypothetical protein